MNETNLHNEPPKTVKEIGIHLVYMTQSINSLEKKVDDLPNGFASIKSQSVLEARVAVLESKNNIKTTLLWVGLVASAIINIIALYNLFTGKV